MESLRQKIKNAEATAMYDPDQKDDSPKNKIASALTILAYLIFLVGAVLGIVMGDDVYNDDFVWNVAFTWWGSSLLCGSLFLGISEVIKLLYSINLNIAHVEEEKK